MPLPTPTVYDRAAIAQFMRDTLAAVAYQLTDERTNWQDTEVDSTEPEENGPYTEPVNETELRVGAVLGDFTDVPVRFIRLVARLELWRAIMSHTTGDYDVGGPSRTTKREQVYLHARQMFLIAERDLAAYLLELANAERLAEGMIPSRSRVLEVVAGWKAVTV